MAAPAQEFVPALNEATAPPIAAPLAVGPAGTAVSQPSYYVVLHTDPGHGGAPSTLWTTALSMLAALAEENPGYLGYDVQEMDGGREYAVTYWRSPAHIQRWKKSVAIVVGDNGLLDRIYGQEGCLWPWLDRAKLA